MKPPVILIVEDEPRLRDLLVRAVTDWGLAATGAHSGEEAVRRMADAPADIVLLDLNLPGMSGIECFEAIRQRWPQTQVIILTGFGDLESAKKAIHLDVVEFLTKPCHLGDLEIAIDRARKRLPPPLPQVILDEPFPVDDQPPADAQSPPTLHELEREHILAALARHQGNRAAAAAELGISLRTLYYRLTEYQKQGYLRMEE